ncbi:hypothetical protein B0H10DRAFT_2107939 [Mycena sp. CBHHK59/15]|nr:hypothetical protein B0H10DRAFT_2107939 [Mycena sp. CBHHK59/15]
MHPVPAAPQAVPTSSLLKCLDNLDILCEIVRYGHGEAANAQPGDSALPRLALVCRAFCEPALDALWRSMGSLLPLLKLLPSFQEVKGVYVLLGPLQAEDWVRFDFYAKKVRAMKYTGITDIIIDPCVYLRIVRYHPAPILPQLHQLYLYNHHRSPSGPEILLFIALPFIILISDHIANLDLNRPHSCPTPSHRYRNWSTWPWILKNFP